MTIFSGDVQSPYQAFECLANLLNRPLLMGFYRMDVTKVHTEAARCHGPTNVA